MLLAGGSESVGTNPVEEILFRAGWENGARYVNFRVVEYLETMVG